MGLNKKVYEVNFFRGASTELNAAGQALAYPASPFRRCDEETYRSGHNEPHSKCGHRFSGAWVRIPPSPFATLKERAEIIL